MASGIEGSLRGADMDIKEEVDQLQKFPVFGGMDGDTLEKLLYDSNLHNLQQGHCLFSEGDPARSFFVVMQGSLQILKRCGAKTLTLNTLYQGDCVGELALFDLLPRTASAKACVPTRCLEISTRQLLDIYKEDVNQFVLLQMNLGRELARRLREADSRLIAADVSAEVL